MTFHFSRRFGGVLVWALHRRPWIAAVYYIVGKVDQELGEAAFGSGIVTED